jgi:hypothetical protein
VPPPSKGGDLSSWSWGEGGGGNMLDCCRPIKVEVFEISDDNLLEGWEMPECPEYKGLHGLVIPSGEKAEK